MCIAHGLDNVAAVAEMTKRGGGSMRGTQHGRRWRQHLDYRWIQLRPYYESGEEMETKWRTDKLSRRQTAWWEWKIRTPIVQRIVTELGLDAERTRMIDMFAEPATRRWSRYVTRSVLLDDGKLWTDALARTWEARENPLIDGSDVLWMFPPPRLWPEVVGRPRQLRRGQRAVLIMQQQGAPTAIYEWATQHKVREVQLPGLREMLTPPECKHNSQAYQDQKVPAGSWIGVSTLVTDELDAGTSIRRHGKRHMRRTPSPA